MRLGKALIGLALVSAGCLAVLTASPSVAQETAAMKQVGMVRTGAGTFTIDVEGADVRTVVMAIAEFSGRNIVVAQDVKGTVKITLRNVGWQEALRTTLRSVGLDYIDEGGILRVDESSKLSAEIAERATARAKEAELLPLETRVIKLNYANGQELMTAIQASMTRRGQIQVDKRTNSLIISDLPTTLDAVEKMARDLDSTTPQIEITAKLVDVDAEALRGIGIEWNVSGLQPNNDPASDLSVDHATPIADPATTIKYGLTKSWGQIQAKIELLEQNRKANIISNPRITTVDNREAKILVGQKIPLIVQDVAGNPVSQLQTIGIQLKVTPHLTDDNRIIMDLHPEVSDLSTQSTVQGGVIINTSEADTRVMVDDGQTAVIGGLIRTNDGVVRRGLPLLKDIPLIGMLFRSNNTIRQNRELIIFVTPKIIQTTASNN
jgi:type IV pilus assembly protein PilQ